MKVNLRKVTKHFLDIPRFLDEGIFYGSFHLHGRKFSNHLLELMLINSFAAKLVLKLMF